MLRHDLTSFGIALGSNRKKHSIYSHTSRNFMIELEASALFCLLQQPLLVVVSLEGLHQIIMVFHELVVVRLRRSRRKEGEKSLLGNLLTFA